MRSSWKIASLDNAFYRKSFLIKLNKLDAMKLWSKGTRIFSNLLEKSLNVYNGSKFIVLPVKKEMLGTFIGSYVLTKRITSDIHSKSKKNKKGRMKKKKK